MLKGLNTRPIRKYGDQSLIPPRVSNSPGFTVLTRTSCSWTVLRDFVFCGKRLQRPLQPNLHFQIPENEAQCGERTCPEQLIVLFLRNIGQHQGDNRSFIIFGFTFTSLFFIELILYRVRDMVHFCMWISSDFSIVCAQDFFFLH